MNVVTYRSGFPVTMAVNPVKGADGTSSIRESFRNILQGTYDTYESSVSQDYGQGELAAPSRTILSSQDIAELASKYDPHNMSQAEYDAFLNDLVEKGALLRSDALRVGYMGFRALDADLDELASTGLGGGTACIIRQEYFADTLKESLADAENDPARWVQIMLARKYEGTDLRTEEGISQRTDALNALSSILNRMETQRT